jgi:hypothetical protein
MIHYTEILASRDSQQSSSGEAEGLVSMTAPRRASARLALIGCHDSTKICQDSASPLARICVSMNLA